MALSAVLTTVNINIEKLRKHVDNEFVINNKETDGKIVEISNKIVGEKTTGNIYILDKVERLAEAGAEIFNDYENNKAVGKFSHAEGEYTKASGTSAHSEGTGTYAKGEWSHSEGCGTRALGNCSHTEGNGTTAQTVNSHAEGYYTEASGASSHAEGSGTKASGNYSHAEGFSTKAYGDYSHAEGQGSIARGEESHAEGCYTEAYGKFSHAEGNSTYAGKSFSHAEGNNTRADSNCQHVEGEYNVVDTSDTYVHIVGNGNSSARSNAHTLDWSGNAWYQGDVYVGSTSGVNRDEDSKKLATEDFVNEQIGNVSPVQSDWNQNNESELDYIKNRPFYAGDPELTEVFNGNISFNNHASFISHFSLLEGEKYQVIWNNQEYFCTCQKSTIGANQFLCIGNTSLAATDSTQWIDGEPFLIQDGGFATIVNTSDDNSSCSAIVNIYKEYVKLLDRKFVSYMAGENVEGKTVTYNNQTYTCPTGAEIFNSPTNKAIGLYSHAEGHGTVAYGAWCHAEGVDTYVNGNGSHAEGQSTIVEGAGSHAEGGDTIASGDYIHVEGYHTIASSNYQHVQGKHNIEDAEDKYAHIVGNGTENTPSNAHTLDWNGNAWYKGSVEATSIILSSPSGKRFNITVGDDGILTSTEIVLEE